jgi:iron complex transport system ATP-binding protein
VRALLEARGIEFAYPAPSRRGGRPFRLERLSFEVLPGEILGVIGPNSAGKTTLIRLLTRVVEPLGGEVRLEEVPLARWRRWELARRVAVVAQDPPPAFPYTVEQLVLMGRYPHGPGRFFERPEDLLAARQAMAATGVLELAACPLERLSGGERQRAVLARALAQEPRLLILDEPTAHLDLRYQAEVAGLLVRLRRERDVTILLVSHDLGLAAALADRLLLLHGGRLARAGAPESVLDEALLSEVYGTEVRVEKRATDGRLAVHVTWPDGPEGR